MWRPQGDSSPLQPVTTGTKSASAEELLQTGSELKERINTVLENFEARVDLFDGLAQWVNTINILAKGTFDEENNLGHKLFSVGTAYHRSEANSR